MTHLDSSTWRVMHEEGFGYYMVEDDAPQDPNDTVIKSGMTLKEAEDELCRNIQHSE